MVVFNWELFSFSPFSDILDIALITFAIYKIVMWVKDTKAMSLFRGIAFILFIAGLAVLFNLTTIWWLVRNLFNISIIALLIIFQPELRRALEEIGRGKLVFDFMGKEEKIEENNKEFLELIINVAFKLAKSKTGALIILEKQNSLSELIETGIILEANLTKELLENIFYHNAPMHDGAVVIRGNKILAASCILPLSTADVSSDLGTRHRAGLGASEHYDSISIICSEETGKVSVCIEGELLKGVDEQTLAEMLLGTSKRKRKKLKGVRRR
ncbi:MAG: diadenylate cyclase CdaA [Defluviitaleaceae bacterium]|nr:diadenylate cyclase CdaA [Defluviitaleaceae bacterium]